MVPQSKRKNEAGPNERARKDPAPPKDEKDTTCFLREKSRWRKLIPAAADGIFTRMLGKMKGE
jgi:hypothetical protein